MALDVWWGLLAAFLAVFAGGWIGLKTLDERTASRRISLLFQRLCLLVVAFTLLFFAFPYGVVDVVLFGIGLILACIPLFQRFRFFFLGAAIVAAPSVLLVSGVAVIFTLLFVALHIPERAFTSFTGMQVISLLVAGVFLLLPISTVSFLGMFLAGYLIAVK